MPKRVLVTGGAGFIGSHLCEKLNKLGHEVFSLDNYSTGKEENEIKGVRYIRGDTKNIEKLVSGNFDLVYHLGEYARVEKSFEDVEKVWESNRVGTLAVLEFCRKNKIKIVYAGSSTKFGDGGLGRDQSPYAWSKASNTELVQNYSTWFGLQFAITYFYNVYGPRELSNEFGSVIGIFDRLSREGKSLPVVSPGTQRRIFTHVDDIVSGLVLVGEKGEGDGFGLGSVDEFSILEIAELFSEETGIGTTMLPERKGNRMAASLDITRAASLGWKPQKHIREYIKELACTYS